MALTHPIHRNGDSWEDSCLNWPTFEREMKPGSHSRLEWSLACR